MAESWHTVAGGWRSGEPLQPEKHGDLPKWETSGAGVFLGDPVTRTNDRTVAMGIAFRTSMILPAPNITFACGGGRGDEHARGSAVAAWWLRTVVCSLSQQFLGNLPTAPLRTDTSSEFALAGLGWGVDHWLRCRRGVFCMT